MKCATCFKLNPYDLIYLILLCVLFSCNNKMESDSVDNTLIGLQIQWPMGNREYLVPEDDNFKKDICNDYGVDKITVIIQNKAGDLIEQNDWECDDHKGILSNIPTGSGYEISVIAYVNGHGDWMASEKDILITKGTTTVKVQMKYQGSDHFPPKVESAYPAPSSLDIPVSENIRIQFDDSLMHSSINHSSFNLWDGSLNVPGNISHMPGSDTIYFDPTDEFDYDTVYTVTLTSQILDKANNPMENDYNFSFRTIHSSQNKLYPPAGFKGEPGYSMVSLSWDKVTDASEYHVYMSKSKSITTEPTGYLELKRVDSTTYNWVGLQPNEPHYFIVTAVNSFEESDPTYYITETPQLIPFEKDLVAFYDFLDVDGQVKDMSENKNHGWGYDVQASTDRLGRKNSAVYFNGQTSYIQVDALNSFNSSNFTVAIIFRTYDHKNEYWLFTKGYNNRNFSFQISGNAVKNKGYLYYSHILNSGIEKKTFSTNISGNKIHLNKYCYVAVTLKKSKSNNNHYHFNSYINGNKHKVVDTFKPFKNDSPLIIGAGGLEMMSKHFKGVIDDLVIYKRVLTSKEIKKLYKSAKMKAVIGQTNLNSEWDDIFIEDPKDF